MHRRQNATKCIEDKMHQRQNATKCIKDMDSTLSHHRIKFPLIYYFKVIFTFSTRPGKLKNLDLSSNSDNPEVIMESDVVFLKSGKICNPLI